MKLNVYLISGLGADKRVFQKIIFDEGIEVRHIEWIAPGMMNPLILIAKD